MRKERGTYDSGLGPSSAISESGGCKNPCRDRDRCLVDIQSKPSNIVTLAILKYLDNMVSVDTETMIPIRFTFKPSLIADSRSPGRFLAKSTMSLVLSSGNCFRISWPGST